MHLTTFMLVLLLTLPILHAYTPQDLDPESLSEHGHHIMKRQNNPNRRRGGGHGRVQKFCNNFGCDCTPPRGAKCCSGYRFDKKTKKCKQLNG